MRLCVLGSNNIYVRETTKEFSKNIPIELIILKSKNDNCGLDGINEINVTPINKQSLFELLKLPFLIKNTSKDVDGFLIHYLNPYFALLIAAGLLKKPKIYLSYGGDIHKTGLRKWIVKKSLQRIDFTFVEMKTDKELLINEFNVSHDRVKSLIWYPVSKCFFKMDTNKRKELRVKWGFTKKYNIFSPRTLIEFYNHDILIKSIGSMEKSIRDNIEVILTGLGDYKYRNNLLNLAKSLDVNVVDLGRVMSPEEMSELYNISLITCNIPRNDGIGRSIIEGALCGSIPLLNNGVDTYHDFFLNEVNCIFVECMPESICEGIKNIIFANEDFKDKINKNFCRYIFKKYYDWKLNKKIIVSKIEEMVTNVQR